MRMFSHTCHLFLQRRGQIIRQELQYAEGKKVLELGSISWGSWIEENYIRPGELHCINISQEELNQGIEGARDSSVKPHFQLMDAHHLDFQDECFDLVFGCAILHHLDFVKAVGRGSACSQARWTDRVCRADGSQPHGQTGTGYDSFCADGR